MAIVPTIRYISPIAACKPAFSGFNGLLLFVLFIYPTVIGN